MWCSPKRLLPQRAKPWGAKSYAPPRAYTIRLQFRNAKSLKARGNSCAQELSTGVELGMNFLKDLLLPNSPTEGEPRGSWRMDLTAMLYLSSPCNTCLAGLQPEFGTQRHKKVDTLCIGPDSWRSGTEDRRKIHLLVGTVLGTQLFGFAIPKPMCCAFLATEAKMDA